jgi:hypothetical protein
LASRLDTLAWRSLALTGLLGTFGLGYRYRLMRHIKQWVKRLRQSKRLRRTNKSRKRTLAITL